MALVQGEGLLGVAALLAGALVIAAVVVLVVAAIRHERASRATPPAA